MSIKKEVILCQNANMCLLESLMVCIAQNAGCI
nr:MAG TPA: hypothetical protein [Caudoviricetes sp.]